MIASDSRRRQRTIPTRSFRASAGGAVAVRRTLASTICRIADPMQVARPRQLRDASTVMRFRPAHQSMINRRFRRLHPLPCPEEPETSASRESHKFTCLLLGKADMRVDKI